MKLSKRVLRLVLLGALFSTLTQADDSNPSGYYDYYKEEVVIKKDGLYRKIKVKVTILDARSDHLSRINLSKSGKDKLSDVKFDVFNSKGKKIYSRKKDDMLKACGFGASYSMYDDICTFSILLPGPTYPYSIEYKYKLYEPVGLMYDMAVIQRQVPIRRFEYSLKVPKDFGFRHSIKGDVPDPRVEQKGKNIKYSWELDSVSAFDLPEYTFIDDAALMSVEIVPDSFSVGGYACSTTTWDGVASWYRRMAKGRYLDSVEEVSDKSQSVYETTVDSYNRVIDNLRYVSVSIGVGGWQPHPASYTLEKGYGDCKDLTTLLLSYLFADSIVAYPVLVRTRESGRIDPEFPSIRFNHVISVAIDGNDTLWMDPTCLDCPFGTLPSGDSDIDVLVITDNKGLILRTPRSKAEQNRLEWSGEMFVDDEWKLRIDGSWELEGEYARDIRSTLRRLSTDERESFVTKVLPSSGRRFELVDYRVENLNSIREPLYISMSFASKRPVTTVDGCAYLPSFLFTPNYSFERIDLVNRNNAIVTGFPFLGSERMVTRWSPSLSIDSVVIPVSDSVQFTLGQFYLHTVNMLDSIIMKRELSYFKYEIPVDQFGTFKEFVRTKQTHTQQAVRIYFSSE